MAGKNTAVFGIYQTQIKLNVSSTVSWRTGSPVTTFRSCYPITRVRRTLPTRRTQRPPRERPPVSRRGAPLAERWVCWRELGRLRFRGLALLSQLARSWVRSRDSEWEAQWAV